MPTYTRDVAWDAEAWHSCIINCVLNETSEVLFLNVNDAYLVAFVSQVVRCQQYDGGVTQFLWTTRMRSMLTQAKWSIINWSCPSWREVTCTQFTPARPPTTTSANLYVLPSLLRCTVSTACKVRDSVLHFKFHSTHWCHSWSHSCLTTLMNLQWIVLRCQW